MVIDVFLYFFLLNNYFVLLISANCVWMKSGTQICVEYWHHSS